MLIICHELFSEKTVLFGDIIGGADVVVASEAGAVQNHLEHFTEVYLESSIYYAQKKIITQYGAFWILD